MRIRAAALTAAILCLPLTACGNDSGSSNGKNPAAGDTRADKPKSKDDGAGALEKSVRAYTKALFGADADTGYALLSERCKGQMSSQEFEALAKDAHHEYGSLTIKNLSVDQMSGDMARVSYGVGVPQFERKAQPWTREAGTWRWDACQDGSAAQ
ncbi:hypothetical protein [Streptomyces sp. NPDC094472]|uniref:hypothetical protein n=1 Tax=Streptomyces sp. NPDC094472 TaxID=3155080 RepID=UPI00331D9616